MNEPWQSPDPPNGPEPLIAVDPRVDGKHVIGALPCPKNPPPPVGWEYWKGPVSHRLVDFAEMIRDDSVRFPMGAFAQAVIEGELIGARVEWHDLKGRTGERGCFRGVNLMRHVAQPAETELATH